MTDDPTDDPVAELHRRGVANFAELIEGGEERLKALFKTVPGLGEVAVGVVYGHLHERPALDPRTREVATLAAIVAAGMVGPPLSVHLRTGLASGLSPAEITETVVQTAAFAGFPRAVSAASELNRLFAELGLESPPPTAPREVVLDALRAGAVAPEAIGDDTEVRVTATSPENVLVEVGADVIVRVRVRDGAVESVTVFRS